MRILLDNCVPVKLCRNLAEHDVKHARDMGWTQLSNGKLLQAAESALFDVLITIDKGFLHQQNLANRNISVIFVDTRSSRLEQILFLLPQVKATLLSIGKGELIVVKG